MQGYLYKVSTEDLCKGSQRVRSLFKLSGNDLQARPLLFNQVSVQDLHKRSHGKISAQDLSTRALLARSL